MRKADGVGYEYIPVKWCSRTGRPFVTPVVWNAHDKKTGAPIPAPIYPTCLCHGRDGRTKTGD